MSVSLLVNALILSSLYAIVAIGFTLIFGVGGVLNLSHGSLLTLGAFTSYYIASILEYSLLLATVTAVVVSAVAGAVIYLTVIRSIGGNMLVEMIITLLIGVTLEHLLRIFVTHSTITIETLIAGNTLIAGYTVQNHMVLIFVVSWIIIGGLFALVEFSDVGRAIIAISMNKKGAAHVGIDIDRINLYTWTLAAALAGLAGVFLLSFQTGDWRMGTDPLIISFAIVILGGLGSIRGSIAGAYAIGTIETLTTSLINPQLTGFASLLTVLLVLLVRPSGLFGRQSVEEMFGNEGLFEDDKQRN